MTADDGPRKHPELDHTREVRRLMDLLGHELPKGFCRAVIRLVPGESLSCNAASWRDALILLSRGEIEVRAPDGFTGRFATGAVIAFAEIPLSVVHAVGVGQVVLTAVRRCDPEATNSEFHWTE